MGRVVFEGDLPSPTEIVPGCAFASHCPIMRDRCRVECPLLREVADGQSTACHSPRRCRSRLLAVLKQWCGYGLNITPRNEPGRAGVNRF
jgi:hypothetical protein